MTAYDNLPHGYTIGGRFLVEDLLGKGRSSAVYRAFDIKTATKVCLKILDPFLAHDPVSLERFRREVSIVRSLSHPNIIKIYAFLRSGEFHVIVMECFESMDGTAYLDRYGPLPVFEFLSVAKKIAASIESCHKLKILHRDIKPQNVLISPELEIKVVDFGISRINTMSDLTKTGTALGTPEYMAPELFSTGRADPRSDIYSLGCVFYELLTRRPPYTGTSFSAIISQQIRQEITRLAVFRQDIPAWLEKVVLKCLHTDPDKRYQSCFELLTDLERGERALFSRTAAVAECFGCKGELIPGLSFCHHCGKFSHEIFETGSCALILHSCGNPRLLIDYLRKAFPDCRKVNLTDRLAQLPTLLFKNISKEMAHSIVNELAHLSLELSIVETLPRHFQLPYYFLLVGLFPFLLVAFTPLGKLIPAPLLLPVEIVSLVLGELAIFALYRQRVRSVITLGASGRKAASAQTSLAAKMSARFRNLTQQGLKNLMGHIVQKYLSVSARARESALTVDQGMLTGLVWSAFEAAEHLEQFETFLSSTSLNAIKAGIDRVQMRISQSSDTAALTGLIEEKSRLEADFARYTTVQDKHARLNMSLLDLRVLLNRLEASLEVLPEELATLGRELATEVD